MSIGTWVVRSIALQQIDNAPHAKSSAEGYNKSLQSINSGSEKLHRASFSPGVFPAMKKAAISGGRLHTSGHFVPKSCLCKGVRIVDVIIIEDVLVLACEPIVRHSHGIHLT
jgi:hypothetical protein